MNQSKKHKVLFYFGGFAPTGGIETFCKNLLSYLESQQHLCELVCWGKSSELLKAIEKHNIKLTYSFWRWGCKWNLPDWLLLPIGIKSLENADVVILGKLFPYAILRILKLKAKPDTKFIYITPYKPLMPNSLEEKENMSKSLNIFDAILVQSNSFIQNLRETSYRGVIEVIPYITNIKGEFQCLPPKELLQIGFLGRLVKDKNVPLLLRSFAHLKKNSSFLNDIPCKLNLFGDGHLRYQLENLAHDLGIKDSVVFHGDIPHNQIQDAINSCHLFVFTSINEGQCLAALEILSCGRPLVATDAGALPEILSDQRLGRLVNSKPEDVAMGILEVANLIQQDMMSPKNIESAYLERYSVNTVGQKYKNVINSLLAST